MRKITKTIKICHFDELNEEAKERAINNEREVTLDYEWWKWILEDLVEQCAKLGVKFEVDDVRFDLCRGGYCYVLSDDLSFDWQSEVNLPAKFGAYQNYMGGGINGQIQSEEVDESRITERAPYERADIIINKLNSCYAIFEDTLERLWKEYTEIQTDEYLIDIIKGNDFEYTEEGEMYNG